MELCKDCKSLKYRINKSKKKQKYSKYGFVILYISILFQSKLNYFFSPFFIRMASSLGYSILGENNLSKNKNNNTKKPISFNHKSKFYD